MASSQYFEELSKYSNVAILMACNIEEEMKQEEREQTLSVILRNPNNDTNNWTYYNSIIMAFSYCCTV